jgi:hypothetical protein
MFFPRVVYARDVPNSQSLRRLPAEIMAANATRKFGGHVAGAAS